MVKFVYTRSSHNNFFTPTRLFFAFLICLCLIGLLACRSAPELNKLTNKSKGHSISDQGQYFFTSPYEGIQQEIEGTKNTSSINSSTKKSRILTEVEKRQAKIKAAIAAKVKAKTIKAIESNMVFAPAGSFTMGHSDETLHGDKYPPRLVTLRPFLINRYEVTRDEFAVFAQDTNLKYKECESSGGAENFLKISEDRILASRNWSDPPQFDQYGNHPVVCIDMASVEKFILWLNKETGKKYRLPSEAEWEYASRAGINTEFHWGDEAPDIQVNCHWCNDTYVHTSPVGTFPANPWGLYDTVGNVSEWMEDCYVYSYKNAHVDNTPKKMANCELNVVRGGSWGTRISDNLKPIARQSHSPDKADNKIGFRLVRGYSSR